MDELYVTQWNVGDKVIFIHPDYGYDGDIELAAEHLKGGETYTLSRIDVGQSSSMVELNEVPGIMFNSVHFIIGG